MININLDKITDKALRENLETIANEFQFNPFLNGSFNHFEIETSVANTNYLFRHALGFAPKDVWITFVSAGTASINYNKVDKNNIGLNISGPCTVRFIAGSVIRQGA